MNAFLKKNQLLCLIALLVFSMSSVAQIESEMVDERDGQTYPTVIIDITLESGIVVPREWMTKNLNYESPGSFCYKGYEAYCESFGRLYTWDEAKEVCPPGWHLPRSLEWEQVYRKYGSKEDAASGLKEGGDSEFKIQMSGFGELDGTYIDIGVNGYYWTVDNNDASASGLLTFHSDTDEITDVQIGEHHKNSIRCVRDY